MTTPTPSSSSAILAVPPTIEIVVEPDGSTSVQTRGYVGSSCREASAFIERALGTTTSETLTAEFHQTAQQSQHERLSE